MDMKGSEKLIDVFGSWPSFHDAEVLRFSLDRAASGAAHGPTIECTIHVFKMTNEVDEKGYLVLKNHVLVTFRFMEASQPEFKGFNNQNVLWGLEIEDISRHQLERVKYAVNFPSSYGFDGSLQCFDIEVAQVVRCDPEGNPTAD